MQSANTTNYQAMGGEGQNGPPPAFAPSAPTAPQYQQPPPQYQQPPPQYQQPVQVQPVQAVPTRAPVAATSGGLPPQYAAVPQNNSGAPPSYQYPVQQQQPIIVRPVAQQPPQTTTTIVVAKPVYGAPANNTGYPAGQQYAGK